MAESKSRRCQVIEAQKLTMRLYSNKRITSGIVCLKKKARTAFDHHKSGFHDEHNATRDSGQTFIIVAKLPSSHPMQNATRPAMQMIYSMSLSASFCPWKSMLLTDCCVQ